MTIPMHAFSIHPWPLQINQSGQRWEALSCIADATVGMKAPNQDRSCCPGFRVQVGKGRERGQEQREGGTGMLTDQWG